MQIIIAACNYLDVFYELYLGRGFNFQQKGGSFPVDGGPAFSGCPLMSPTGGNPCRRRLYIMDIAF